MTVDGFADGAQLSAGGGMNDDIFSAVHPDLDGDDIGEKTNKLRKMNGAELWELVDAVMPAAE